MKWRKMIGAAVAAAAVVASAAVISMPQAYAETINTDTVYREDFDGFEKLNYSPTLKALKDYGWYAADNNTLYTEVDSVPPYKTYEGKFAQIAKVDGSMVLVIASAGEGNSTQNSDIPKYGYGKTFPGASACEAVTGTWEISFDFKPYLSNKMTQFAFTFNTGDESDLTEASAQHNIIAGYGQRFYLGCRDYKWLLDNSVTQGTLKASDIGGEVWYTVKTVLNCDARYYTVELYNRATGELIARRCPISYDKDENISFIKFSALGFKQKSYVFVDNISIEKTEKNAVIYNETFDTFTNESYHAADGIRTGTESEDFSGNSYFKGHTPWRFDESIGNDYCFEDDDTLSSQVVRLGDDIKTAGTYEKSGLIYMQANEPLIDRKTAPYRGMLKTSFKIKPETVADDFSVNVIPDANVDIASDESAFFKIVNLNGTPAVSDGDGEYVSLDSSKWYNVDLTFDAMGDAASAEVTDLSGNYVAKSFVTGDSAPDAIKAIMLVSKGGTSVLADDIKLEYSDRLLGVTSVTVNEEPLTSLSDITPLSTVNVGICYNNQTNQTLNSNVIFALYSDDALVNVQTADFSVQSSLHGTDSQAAEFTVPSDVDTDSVNKMSVFVWDALDGMRSMTQKTGEKKRTAGKYKDYVDFTVDIEDGRGAVILQLTDTQIVDSKQIREGIEYNPAMPKYWLPQLMNQRLFNDLREIINDVKPDLILLTGDCVYGGYDDNGTSFVRLVDFLDRFGIPWAPVFGNHDNESKMGADWQCRYLESRKNCLFKQRTLTGNGNYSIGISQDGELKRVIFMLDSNGCAVMSDESFANGHSKKTAGFGDDQIAWYTAAAEKINADFENMKYTFAFHIQLAEFEDAFAKYGFSSSAERKENGDLASPINIDTREDKAPTDFGYIGRKLKGAWDQDRSVYNGIKAIGADSILVGHEHCNSASVVYDGIRFQYGQKIGEYDRINFKDSDGNITGAVAYATGYGTPVLGGTVMELSENTGEIANAYIHYCSK